MKKILISVLMTVAMLALPLVRVLPAWASCGGVETNLIDCNDSGDKGEAIFAILNIVVNVLSGLVMTAAVLGMIIAGIQYLSARDNEAQVVKAKSRILQIVIGIVAYMLLWAFLEWLIPGGVINSAVSGS